MSTSVRPIADRPSWRGTGWPLAVGRGATRLWHHGRARSRMGKKLGWSGISLARPLIELHQQWRCADGLLIATRTLFTADLYCVAVEQTLESHSCLEEPQLIL